MAQMFAVNVYGLNDNQWSTSQRFAFSPTNVKFRTVYGKVISAGRQVYGIIEEVASGLKTGGNQWQVIETVNQLVTLANA